MHHHDRDHGHDCCSAPSDSSCHGTHKSAVCCDVYCCQDHYCNRYFCIHCCHHYFSWGWCIFCATTLIVLPAICGNDYARPWQKAEPQPAVVAMTHTMTTPITCSHCTVNNTRFDGSGGATAEGGHGCHCLRQ